MKLNFKWNEYLRTFTMVFALIAIWLIFQGVTDGAFLQARNLSNLFRQMSVTGVLAVGMVLVIVAGHIDLSVGSVVCFLGVVLGLLMQKGVDPTTAFALTLGVAFLVSSLQGFLTAYQKVPAFIVTLGGMMIFRGASMGLTGGVTIPLDDSWVSAFGSAYLAPSLSWVFAGIVSALYVVWQIRRRVSRQKLQLAVSSPLAWVAGTGGVIALVLLFATVMNSYEGIPVPVLVMLLLTVIFHFVATSTVFGRHVYAVGGSVEAAHLSGVNVRLVTLGMFLLIGFCTAVASLILTARVGSASPDAGQLLELDAIASCVIGGTSLMGGKGTIFGAILGALVMESLNNGMSMANLDAYWQYIVKGLVLVAAVWLDVSSQKNR